MTMSVEYVRVDLPIKTTPNIIIEPAYKAINDLREVMYANAAAILTKFGGGRGNGHIGLLTDAAIYANVTNTGYTRTADMGPYAHHGPRDTDAEQANTNSIHKEERRLYDLDKNVDATLKQEFATAV